MPFNDTFVQPIFYQPAAFKFVPGNPPVEHPLVAQHAVSDKVHAGFQLVHFADEDLEHILGRLRLFLRGLQLDFHVTMFGQLETQLGFQRE